VRRASSTQGTVRVSASQVPAVTLLPPMLAELHRQEPGLQVELVATNAVSNLLRREADIALRMLRPAQSGLVARKLGAKRGEDRGQVPWSRLLRPMGLKKGAGALAKRYGRAISAIAVALEQNGVAVDLARDCPSR
jgi:hypothetical protein